MLKDITAVGVTGATCVQSYLLSKSWPSSVPHCGLWISKGSAICKSVLRKWENRKTEKQGVGVAPGHLLLGVHHRVTANAVVSMCTHHHEPRHMTPPQPGRPEAIKKQECPLHVILHKPSKITRNNLIRKKKICAASRLPEPGAWASRFCELRPGALPAFTTI